MAENREPQPVFVVPTPAGAVQVVAAPSTVTLVEDQAQVLVDTWGHRGDIVRGMIVNRADAEKAGYDWDHALRVGSIRLLTEAEQRSLPTTYSALADGSPDLGLARATRYHAGLVDELPRTVTTEQGPPEPAEFAKPTLQYSGPNEPPARQVEVVGSPAEARAASAQERRVVATPSGPAFATPEQADAMRKAEEQGASPAEAQRQAAQEQAKAEQQTERRSRRG